MRGMWIIIVVSLLVGGAVAQYNEYSSSGFKPDIGAKGIAGKVGMLYISTKDIGFTPGFGVWIDLGNLSREIGLDAGLEYWNGSWDESGGTLHKRDIAVYATVKYETNIKKYSPFLGGGIGINMYKKTYPEGWSNPDETKNKLELHLDMGTVYSLNEKIDLEGRIKVNFSDFGTYGLYISAIFKTGQSQ
ncbi:outer membrane beta-barrel protein [bacterium]|nr:outer membrane beta-barrel protein [bacterium]